jgi:hypothetical protein
MKQYSEAMCSANLYLAIEAYLAQPNKSNAEIIKNLSHALTNQAYENARVRFPAKRIGADEYAPILLEMIQQQAREALPYSTRIVPNTQGITSIDPQFIFKLSKEQQLKVRHMLTDMLSDANHRHPDGLIYAYDGVIERQASSQYTYCEGVEATIYDYTSKLFEKAVDLQNRGYIEASNVLFRTVFDINIICNQKSKLEKQDLELQQIDELLSAAKKAPALQEHHGVKQILENFILAISVVGLFYLAATANQRGTFWYRPNTGSEDLLEEYQYAIEIPLCT